jgi:His-Xaa-Ser system protein HxsD
LVDVTVEFTPETQSLGALQEAAYRLIGQATCQIEQVGGRFHCRLHSAKGDFPAADLQAKFLDLVTDENLREKLGRETGRTRDVIVALAFGALAADRG